MPAGKGTYGKQVGRPSNKRTGEDFLDREEKKKKEEFESLNPEGTAGVDFSPRIDTKNWKLKKKRKKK